MFKITTFSLNGYISVTSVSPRLHTDRQLESILSRNAGRTVRITQIWGFQEVHFKKAKYDFRKAFRDPKRDFQNRLEAQINQVDARWLWQGLKPNTGYKSNRGQSPATIHLYWMSCIPLTPRVTPHLFHLLWHLQPLISILYCSPSVARKPPSFQFPRKVLSQ